MARLTKLSDHAALLERISHLHAEGQKPPAIAAALNAEGWRPAKRRATFTAEMVRNLLHRQGVALQARMSWASRLDHREATELTISELAARLAMPQATLYRWIQRGVVEARKVRVLTHTEEYCPQASARAFRPMTPRRPSLKPASAPDLNPRRCLFSPDCRLARRLDAISVSKLLISTASARSAANVC